VHVVFFLAKNLSHVEVMSNRRSLLALVSVVMSVINGRGNVTKAFFQSCSIWSSMIQPGCGMGIRGGVERGRSMKSAAWSEEIDRSKEIEHDAGKNRLPRKAIFMKM
jgi:hypothetical protein